MCEGRCECGYVEVLVNLFIFLFLFLFLSLSFSPSSLSQATPLYHFTYGLNSTHDTFPFGPCVLINHLSVPSLTNSHIPKYEGRHAWVTPPMVMVWKISSLSLSLPLSPHLPLFPSPFLFLSHTLTLTRIHTHTHTRTGHDERR